MKRQMFGIGILATMLSSSSLIVGCGRKADDKNVPAKVVKVGEKEGQQPRVLETVDLAPGKAISAEDRAKVSSMGLKVLDHVSKAKKDIQAKNVDAAKKELTQAATLLAVLKQVLPTVKIIDHIWVAKTDLSYVNTTEVQQDLVAIEDSIDQLYAVLPVGKAKEHAKRAKDVLAKEKHKGASKAKEELEAVEEALDFREVDLSVSYTSRLVKLAQVDLDKGKTKDASDALQAVADGLVFFDTALIDPADMAVRSIWMARQDYAGKDYKAAKSRLGTARKALHDVAHSGIKTLKDDAKSLISKIEAIDIAKAEARTGAAIEELWQDARKLVERPQVKTAKAPDVKDKTEKETKVIDKEAKVTDETFVRTADQIDLAEMKLGKIAEDHAATDAVKKFGVRTAHDHTLMNTELRAIASKQGIKLTDVLERKHQELIDELSKLKGPEFDRVYTKDMVAGHEKAIEQFEVEAKTGRDTEVKTWAEKWLPTLREHLKLAQATVKDVKGK